MSVLGHSWLLVHPKAENLIEGATDQPYQCYASNLDTLGAGLVHLHLRIAEGQGFQKRPYAAPCAQPF